MLGSPLFREYGILLAGLVVSALWRAAPSAYGSPTGRAARRSRGCCCRRRGVPPGGSSSSSPRSRPRSAGRRSYLAGAVGRAAALDALRLLRQVPAITELRIADPSGREQIAVSRVALNQVGPDWTRRTTRLFRGPIADRVSYGPVYFRDGSEPYMTVAVSGSGGRTGVTLAEVNLKLIWDLISLDQDRRWRSRIRGRPHRSADRRSRHQPRAPRHRPVAAGPGAGAIAAADRRAGPSRRVTTDEPGSTCCRRGPNPRAGVDRVRRAADGGGTRRSTPP